MKNKTYKERLKEFESKKRKLFEKGVSPKEYEAEIKRLAKEYRI